VTQPRYAPADRLLTLVLALQASRVGLTIVELQAKLGVQRRTVERLLATLRNRHDLDLREEPEPGGTKRWRIATNGTPLALDVTAGEMAALHVATQQVDHSSARIHADALRRLAAKVGAASDERRRATLEADALDMAAAEGLVVRPGPRECIDRKILADLRTAILAPCKVELRYRSRSTGKISYGIVRPYGFLHRTRSYLVAYSENEWAQDVRTFALANVVAVMPQEGKTFSKPNGWSLEKFARQSFGAFVEKPVNVEWRFSPNVAEEASKWMFHPTQKMTRGRDGSLVVRFRAGGLLEMAWHLVTWGVDVKIVKPAELKKMLSQRETDKRFGRKSLLCGLNRGDSPGGVADLPRQIPTRPSQRGVQ